MKLIFIIVCCSLVLSANTQEKFKIKTPNPSPEATVSQMLGNAKISVQYSRPLSRGRKIFGELVPYDSLWRTGASNATLFKTTKNIYFNEVLLKQGAYSLYSIPGKESWTIILNTDTSLHGSFGYKQNLDVFRTTVKPLSNNNNTSSFSIAFINLGNKYNADLQLSWENTEVLIPIKSTDDSDIMALINKTVVAKKSNDAETLFQCANYYYTTNRDLETAQNWLIQASAIDTINFYYPNLLQKIYADTKQYNKAIKIAQKAIELGEKEGMSSTVQSLKNRIKKWQQIITSQH